MANGAELGTGHVSIFATMKGFRSTVLNETQSAGEESSSLFSRLFKGVGSKTGNELGRNLKTSFDGSTGDLGSKAMGKLKSEVSSAARSMSSALLKQQDAAGAVRVAQTKLNEAIAKYGAGSSQAVAAEEKLASAQRKSEAASEKLTTAQDRLKAAKQAVADVKTPAVEAPKTSLFTQAIDRIKNGIRSINNEKLDAAGNKVNTLGSTYEKVSGRLKASTVAIGSLIASGIRSVINYGQNAISAYNEASAATAKFQQIASNNKWSQTQIAGLLDLNKNLGRTGVISAGTLKAAQAQLGTFALSADSIKTLTPALSDLIANQKGYNATSDDGVALANLLGKVMTGNVGALTKYGVTLDANQKKLIQNGTQSQRAATAAQVLEQNFGGVNSALAKTPYGKYVILQHQLAGIKTTIGSGFVTAIGSLGDMGINVVDGINSRLQRFFKWLPNAVGGAVNLLKTGNVSKQFQDAFQVKDSTAKSIEDFTGRAKNAIKGLTDFVKTGSFTTAFKKAFQGMDSGTVKRFEDALSGVRDTLLGVGRNAQASGGMLHTGLSGMDVASRGVQSLTTTLNILKPAIEIVSNIAKAFASLPAPVQGAIGVTAIFGGKISGLIGPISAVLGVLKSVGSGIGSVSGAIGDLVSKRLSKTQAITGLSDTLADAAGNAESAAGSLGHTAGKVEQVGAKASGAAGKTGVLSSSVGGFSAAGVMFGAAALGVTGYLATMSDQQEKSKATTDAFSQAMRGGAESTSAFWSSVQSGKTGDLGFIDKLSSFGKDSNLSALIRDTGTSLSTVQQAVEGNSGALKQLNDAAGSGITINGTYKAKMQSIKDTVNGLRDSYKDTIKTMVDYSTTAQGVNSASSMVQSKFSELSTTLKANGDELSNNKGLTDASSQAIQSATDSLMVNVQQQLAYGKANGTMAQSTQAAKNEIQQMRDQLMQTLEGMGMSEDAAGAYADKLGLIPGNVGTKITENATLTKGEVEAYLDTLNLTPEQKDTVMNALTAQANGDTNNLHINYSKLPKEVKSLLTADNNDAVNKAEKAHSDIDAVPKGHHTELTGGNKGVQDVVNCSCSAIARVPGYHHTGFGGDQKGVNNASNGAVGSIYSVPGYHHTGFGGDASSVSRAASTASGSVASVPQSHTTNFFANLVGSAWDNIKKFMASGAGHSWFAAGGSVHRATGGQIPGFADGGGPSGYVQGPGTSTSDSIHAMLSTDEFVVRAWAAKRIGIENLYRMNATGKLPGGAVISSTPVVNQNFYITNKGVANPYVNGNIIGRTVASSARASLMGV
ncbi:MAG: hypothetical protein L0L38_00580 [Bifidobacterium mongoliense]|nr:hypothetical protein [Bifidobacterium mongoliense]